MLIQAVSGIFRIIELAILVECIASWIPQMRSNQFMDIVRSITYPILEPCRRLQDKFISDSVIDFSPILALFLLDIIRGMLISLIY